MKIIREKEFVRGRTAKEGNPKDIVYTPVNIAKTIINKFPLSGTVLDPFKGGGAFYDNYPSNVKKDYCELEEGKDFFAYNKHVDWIVSNPPYSIYDQVMDHSYKIADNIVYLIPLSKAVSSMGRIRKAKEYGGVPYIWIVSASKCGFPFGFPACAIYFKKGYNGPTQIDVD